MKCQILERYNCPWGKIIRVRIPNDCLKLNDIVRDANENKFKITGAGTGTSKIYDGYHEVDLMVEGEGLPEKYLIK